MSMENTNVNTETLDQLTVEVRKLNTSKGWRQTGAPLEGPWFAAYCALGMSEWAEALEAYRVKSWSDTCEATTWEPGIEHHPACSGRPHGHPKPVGVGPELADTLIRTIDTADIWNINLRAETERVIEFGWTRPYKHGGKTL